MIPPPSHRPSVVRTILTAMVVVDLLTLYLVVGHARTNALAEGVPIDALVRLFSATTVRGLILVIGAAGALSFGWKPGRLWAGTLALGALALLSMVHAQLFGSPWRHLYFSGLCLLGWLLGLGVSRHRGMPADESYAHIGSIALLGAAYLNGGISKLAYGGVAWTSGIPIQAIIVAQDGLVQDSILGTYRSWVVATPRIAALFSIATLALELAGPLMILGGWLRVLVALGLFAMHANIYVLSHILYWQSMVFLALFGLSKDVPFPGDSESALALPSLFRGRSFAMSTVLLAVCALLAVGHQSRRYAQVRQASTATSGFPVHAKAPPAATPPSTFTALSSPTVTRPPSPPASTPLPLRQVGPFTVGQDLAKGWTVESLEITAGGFIVALSGAPGRVRFEVTCSPSEHRSPFDLGAAHIFYWNDVDFRELEAVGWALREHLRKTGTNQTICDHVRDWRQSAN